MAALRFGDQFDDCRVSTKYQDGPLVPFVWEALWGDGWGRQGVGEAEQANTDVWWSEIRGRVERQPGRAAQHRGAATRTPPDSGTNNTAPAAPRTQIMEQLKDKDRNVHW